MECPFCASSETHVLETRDAPEAMRRRRACGGCGRRFTTYERVETLTLSVRKRDGHREAFDPDKLLAGLVRAAAKRPVAVDKLGAVVERVAGELRRSGGELPADRIGELVLRDLRALDGVAYVRFASVYRQFSEPAEFVAELARLDGSVRSRADDAELPPMTPPVPANPLEIAAEREETADGA